MAKVKPGNALTMKKAIKAKAMPATKKAKAVPVAKKAPKAAAPAKQGLSPALKKAVTYARKADLSVGGSIKRIADKYEVTYGALRRQLEKQQLTNTVAKADSKSKVTTKEAPKPKNSGTKKVVSKPKKVAAKPKKIVAKSKKAAPKAKTAAKPKPAPKTKKARKATDKKVEMTTAPSIEPIAAEQPAAISTAEPAPAGQPAGSLDAQPNTAEQPNASPDAAPNSAEQPAADIMVADPAAHVPPPTVLPNGQQAAANADAQDAVAPAPEGLVGVSMPLPGAPASGEVGDCLAPKALPMGLGELMMQAMMA